MRLLVTRPEPDALKMRGVLEKLGCEGVVEPLLRAAYENCDPIEIGGAQALIATSRSALVALKAQGLLARARELPLFAVGGATAREARALGFALVVAGAAGAHELVTHIVSVADPAAGLLVHLAGEPRAVDFAVELEPHGFRVVAPVVYRMLAAAALRDTTVEQLAGGEIDGVILMSPRTAVIYAQLMRKHGLAMTARELRHFCFSPAVAGQLKSLGRVPIEVAERPRLEELLALVAARAAESQP
jgi:uroporphyrinogen-III synthase